MKIAVWNNAAYEIPEWLMDYYSSGKYAAILFKGDIAPEKRVELAAWLQENAVPAGTKDLSVLIGMLRANKDRVYYIDDGALRNYYYYARGISDKKLLLPSIRIVDTDARFWRIESNGRGEFLTEYSVSDIGYMHQTNEK